MFADSWYLRISLSNLHISSCVFGIQQVKKIFCTNFRFLERFPPQKCSGVFDSQCLAASGHWILLLFVPCMYKQKWYKTLLNTSQDGVNPTGWISCFPVQHSTSCSFWSCWHCPYRLFLACSFCSSLSPALVSQRSSLLRSDWSPAEAKQWRRERRG